eukprot:2575886-Alexandrium_andersonii.AAC.1
MTESRQESEAVKCIAAVSAREEGLQRQGRARAATALGRRHPSVGRRRPRVLSERRAPLGACWASRNPISIGAC